MIKELQTDPQNYIIQSIFVYYDRSQTAMKYNLTNRTALSLQQYLI